MIQIRPVFDLRNKFTEIEEIVNEGNPVYLTINGYSVMVVMSLEQYANLTDNIEKKWMKPTKWLNLRMNDFHMKAYLDMLRI